MMDIERSRSEPPVSVAVDATSVAREDCRRPTQFGLYYPPQKSFPSDGGLWIRVVLPLAIERIETLAASGSVDAGPSLTSNRTGQFATHQTYNTPALATMPPASASQIKWFQRHTGASRFSGGNVRAALR